MRITFAVAALGAALVLAACGKESPPKTAPAGADKTGKTAALEGAAGLIQRHAPVAELQIYLSGLHVMKNNPQHQMTAHHFCRQVNEDLAQCAIFDGNGKEANLVGIEYIISDRLFGTLPSSEKRYWHPHNYEILSGQLIAPWVPDAAELQLMKDKMNSYGKTWHIWSTGMQGHKGDTVPMGEPMLAWSFNRDGELMPGLLQQRDREQKLDTAAKRRERADLVKLAHPQQGVDAMQKDFPQAGAYPQGVQPQSPR